MRLIKVNYPIKKKKKKKNCYKNNNNKKMHLLYIHQVYLSITQSQPDVYNFCTIDKDNCLASTFLFLF